MMKMWDIATSNQGGRASQFCRNDEYESVNVYEEKCYKIHLIALYILFLIKNLNLGFVKKVHVL